MMGGERGWGGGRKAAFYRENPEGFAWECIIEWVVYYAMLPLNVFSHRMGFYYAIHPYNIAFKNVI
jgi:hypothetical protein